MFRLLLLNALVLVALGFGNPSLDITESLDKYWELWKDHHGKTYSGKNEELKRRLIWEENYNKINVHNLEQSMGMHTFTMASNFFGDMTLDEFTQRNGALYSKKLLFGNNVEHYMYQPTTDFEDLPTTVDWRDKGYVTGVKDQGQCGSCWAFSTTGAIEGQYFANNGDLISFSEQELVDCTTTWGNYGCNGGYPDQAYKYLMQYGIEKETDYPYLAMDDTCYYDPSKVVTEVKGFVDVASESETDLQSAAATVGPISVLIDASHSSFQFYSSGVYNEPECSESELDHAVLVVGYGTESDQDYWLVKNSWTTGWGDQGYIKMSRNLNNQCGIATAASYPTL